VPNNGMAKLFTPTEEPGVWVCDTHGEYETTMMQLPGSDRPLPGPCPECDIILLDDARKLKSRQKTHELNHLMDKASIPKRFRSKTFDDYQPSCDSQNRALTVTRKYADNFRERYEAAGGLCLLGPSGTGKSHLACCIGNKIIADGYTCLFTSVIEAVRLVRSTYSGKTKLTETEAIHRFTWPDLLILDEVGMQRGTDNEFLILTELINLRYADMKPTIMLSNLSEPVFEKFVGDRVFDRQFENGGMILPITGQSYRRMT